MRFTPTAFPNSRADELNKWATQQNRLQNQAATGQRIQLPADDPAGMRRVLGLQAQSQQLGQYLGNIGPVQGQAQPSHAALDGGETPSGRPGESATLDHRPQPPGDL